MNDAQAPDDKSYDGLYGTFDSPLANAIRKEVYGHDIGQHSWVDARELEHDLRLLQLKGESRLLDLGCGPGGPFAFALALTGCQGTGLDLSASAIVSASKRAESHGLGDRATLRTGNLDEPLNLPRHSFDAAMALDVVLHLRNRLQTFSEMARVLLPGGRFLFTDAGVITGSVSDEEIRVRSTHGHTQFVPPGFNERMLELAGLHLVDRIDRTESMLGVAARRHRARLAHRAELEHIEGPLVFGQYQAYLMCVHELAQRGAMSRMMYLAQTHGG